MCRLLLAIAFLSVCSTSFSQDYIVTLKADTIFGNVKLLSYDLLDRVQVSENKKKTNFTALQVRRVSLKGEQYAPVKIDNSVRFMKVIRSGFLSLYAHRGKGQGGYDTHVLQKLGQNASEVPNIGFKKIVGELVADCASVAEQVKNGQLDRRDVESLVDQYNICVQSANKERVEKVLSPKTPATELIEQMRSKVNVSDLSNKSDINDLLNSIGDRYKRNESVPAYMKEGLKGYIGSNEDLKTDMEKLFTLIDQK